MPIQISGGVQLSGPVLLDPTGGSSPSPGGAYSFQGSNFGYTSGGDNHPTSGDRTSDIIQKFSFASDQNGTDVGDLATAVAGNSGQSSSTSGYSSGGGVVNSGTGFNVIQKFAFTSDGNATDVGDLLSLVVAGVGQSSGVSGYVSGSAYPEVSNVIQKFPTASDGNATDVGNLTQAKSRAVGQSSADNGYMSAGYAGGSTTYNTIEKFPFSSDGNGSDVGDLTEAAYDTGSGQSSTTHGYATGGIVIGLPGHQSKIEKFAFASDGNATNIGDLSVSQTSGSGQSSTTSGYASGGSINDNYNNTNTIEKFPFASDADGTDVADLFSGVFNNTGQQY